MKVAVFGDLCLDEWMICKVRGISAEAPVPILDMMETVVRRGMAGHLAERLSDFGFETELFSQKTTSIKLRVIDSLHLNQITRIDKNNIHGEHINFDEHNIDFGKFDAIAIADYDKGFLSLEDIEFLCSKNIPIFIDSKKQVLPITVGNPYIKLNKNEFSSLRERPKVGITIVTLGQNGSALAAGVSSVGERIPTISVDVADVTGAGDVYMAALIYSMINNGSDIKTAMKYANIAASISVTRHFTSAIDKKEIEEWLRKI